jgi:hypothetical protein
VKFRIVGAELFRVDGRTDGQGGVTNLTEAFRNFAKASKKTEHKAPVNLINKDNNKQHF